MQGVHSPDKKQTPAMPKETAREKTPSTKTGIASFFHKAEVNSDQLTTNAASVSKNSIGDHIVLRPVQKPAMPRTPNKPGLKVVYPPIFHPVRATTTDAAFPDRLKIREFVLKCIPYQDLF